MPATHQAPILGHRCQKEESLQYLAVKTSGECSHMRQKAVGDLGATGLNGTMHKLTRLQTHSLWAPVQGQQLEKHWGHIGRK